jgi:E3 ubiquitin-protein ligase BOI and related proteins
VSLTHSHRPVLDEATVLLGDAHLLQPRGNTLFSDPRSELTSNNGSGWCFMPRKRARVGDLDAGACRGLIMDGHGGGPLLPPPPVPVAQAFTAAGDSDVESREHGSSGAASTTGPALPVASQGLVSLLHRHGVEVDALVRIEVSSSVRPVLHIAASAGSVRDRRLIVR